MASGGPLTATVEAVGVDILWPLPLASLGNRTVRSMEDTVFEPLLATKARARSWSIVTPRGATPTATLWVVVVVVPLVVVIGTTVGFVGSLILRMVAVLSPLLATTAYPRRGITPTPSGLVPTGAVPRTAPYAPYVPSIFRLMIATFAQA